MTAILLMGGASKRFGSDKSLLVHQNQPFIVRLLKIFSLPAFKKIILVYRDNPQKKKIELLLKKASFSDNRLSFVKGGKRRQDSVLNALKSLQNFDNNLIFIHDYARVFLQENILKELIEKGSRLGNVVLARKCVDSVKKINKGQTIIHSLNREELCLSETPQVFPYQDLIRAYEYCFTQGKVATDEASAIEIWNKKYKIFLHFHDTNNRKITYFEDI